MSVLTDTLAAELGSCLRLNSAVKSIEPSGEQYALHLANGASEEFDSVILAAPAYAQAEILREMAPGIAAVVDAIEYPSLAVICMGYSKARANSANPTDQRRSEQRARHRSSGTATCSKTHKCRSA